MVTRVRKVFRLQLLPLVIGFIALATIIGTRSLLIETQREDNEAVRSAFELERHIVATLSLMQDAETGQRGYLLTGETAYLEPYDNATAAISSELDVLREARLGDPERETQFAKLTSLINDKLNELARTIGLFRDGKREEALQLMQGGRGRAYMDEIREIITAIRRDEGAIMQARLTSADDAGEWLRFGSIVTLLGVLVLGALSAWDQYRRLKAIEMTQRRLTETNQSLVAEISSREAAEAQMRQMQKMEAIGQLTGGIAHDFNNMLAIITSAMNLVRRKLSRGETDVGQFVDAATDAASRAASLTARLLAFSRQQPLAPQVLDANKLVAGMSDMLLRTIGEAVQIETVLAGGLWKTKADPSQLENAIVNLAVNARDAMPGGGRLTIETANCHLDDAYAAAHAEVPAGQYVLVAVSDTGTGMPPDVAAKAFDPFFTTKPVDKGTGLGLSQVYGFVKQSGGHVKIYSEPGQGTTIKIYLQRHFGEESQSTAPSAPVRSGGGETVLFVEDDQRVRSVTVAALRELGYTVLHAADADAALQVLKSHPDVELLFTDIVMPGMNGRKLADEALRLKPGIRLLFTTGFTRNAVVHNGVLDHGVNFLAKPFTLDQLAAKLRDVLDG